MTELLVKLPENQVPFFMALLERLQFVEVEKVNGRRLSKEQFLRGFDDSLQEAKLHLEGKIRLSKIEDVLHEL